MTPVEGVVVQRTIRLLGRKPAQELLVQRTECAPGEKDWKKGASHKKVSRLDRVSPVPKIPQQSAREGNGAKGIEDEHGTY